MYFGAGSRLALFRALGTLLIAGLCPTLAQAQSPAFLSRPDIHGEQVVFTSEGDLWLGSLTDGSAARLTADPGMESTAHFSPDGKQIAYTAQYDDAAAEVYVINTSGGTPKRLTFHATNGLRVIGWTPDGKNVLFRSPNDTQDIFSNRLYAVPASGGTPKPLAIPNVEHAAMNADGSHIAYVPVSAEWQNWYRYQGGEADDIYVTKADGKTFTQLTTYKGIDTTPVWVGKNIYFVSERSGTGNLWRIDPDTKAVAQITKFIDYPIRYPATDGKRIVMEYGNGIALADPATGTAKPLTFALRSDRIHALPRVLTVPTGQATLALGPTGKRILSAYRGQIVSVPTESGDARTVVNDSASRAQYPAWSPDGKQFAYVSDKSGEEQIWIAPTSPSDTTAARKLTTEHVGPLGQIVWSPDGKYLLTSDREMRIILVDTATGAMTTIYQGRFGGSYDSTLSDYKFSPDGKWIVFSGTEAGWAPRAFLYEIATKKQTPLTTPDVQSYAPVFDPSGKYLLYLSDREIAPRDNYLIHFFGVQKTTKITLLTLAKSTASPFLPDTDEEGATNKTNKPDDDKKDESSTKDAAAKKPLPVVTLDIDGLTDRVVDIPLPASDYNSLAITADGRLLTSDGSKLISLSLKPKAKPVTISEDMNGYIVSADGKKLLIRRGASCFVVDATTGPLAPDVLPVDLSRLTITVNPRDEWNQIFHESWRIARDFFYDPAMHGIDWKAVKTKYEAQLPAVYDRSDLTRILANMISELNTGHAYVGGGDNDGVTPRRRVPQGFLGADFEAVPGTNGTDAFRIKRLFSGDGFDMESRSPLLAPGVNVHPGDYVLAVGGQPVSAASDIAALLVGTAGKTITITVNSKPEKTGARTVVVRPLSSGAERNARYYAWVESRREYIRQHAGGANIAYLHIPDMGEGGLREFVKHYYAATKADAIVYDVRENGGGSISAELLLQMSAHPLSYFKPRYGESWTRQDFGFAGYSVALCNENSGSNAEEFCDAFQRMKLGPVIGTRTWGGEVGSGGGYPLVDGGSLNIPNYGAWVPDGKWIIEGEGAIPDIEVAQEPGAVLAGRDPQLDKAIAVLLEKLKKEPIRRPVPPPFPNKAFKAAVNK